MWQGITKLTTGSDFKTSSSSHTSPFFPIASFLRHDVSSTRRPERRDELISTPSQQLQPPQCLFIRLPSLPTPSTPNVVIPMINAQPLAKSALTAAACTTTLPCIGDQGDPSSSQSTISQQQHSQLTMKQQDLLESP